MTPKSVIRAAVVFSMVLGAGLGLSPSTAQESATDRVVAFTRGAPVLVDVLDVISGRTRFDLLTNSELRLCHYRIGRFLTMKGPARITISSDGIIVEAGKAVDVSQDTCAVVKASKFQGGIVTRGATFK
jgi:hypothetical protein